MTEDFKSSMEFIKKYAALCLADVTEYVTPEGVEIVSTDADTRVVITIKKETPNVPSPT